MVERLGRCQSYAGRLIRDSVALAGDLASAYSGRRLQQATLQNPLKRLITNSSELYGGNLKR